MRDPSLCRITGTPGPVDRSAVAGALFPTRFRHGFLTAPYLLVFAGRRAVSCAPEIDGVDPHFLARCPLFTGPIGEGLLARLRVDAQVDARRGQLRYEERQDQQKNSHDVRPGPITGHTMNLSGSSLE